MYVPFSEVKDKKITMADWETLAEKYGFYRTTGDFMPEYDFPKQDGASHAEDYLVIEGYAMGPKMLFFSEFHNNCHDCSLTLPNHHGWFVVADAHRRGIEASTHHTYKKPFIFEV